MTPIDILPYYLAVEPAPTDGSRCAFAVATHVAGDEIGVSVMLEEHGAHTEIFRFSQLGFVHIAWSPCGSRLALAHNCVLLLRDADGTMQMTSLPGDVQWLGFDHHNRLWSLANERLEARLDGHLIAVIDSVECAAAASVVTYCRREADGRCVYVHDGTTGRLITRLPPSGASATVQISVHARVATVVVAFAAAHGRLRTLIGRIDLLTDAVDWLADEVVGFGLNGGPTVRAAQSSDGEVLASYESAMFCRVWSLTEGQQPVPISPEGMEVFDFAVDAGGERLAIIASDPDSAIGVFERQLLLAIKTRGQWRLVTRRSGVYHMPRWRHDGQLEILCGSSGRWTKRLCSPEAAQEVAREAGDAQWIARTEASAAGTVCDYLRLPGPATRCAGIILLPRLHQQFLAGAQPFFFHHAVFCIARELALQGFIVTVMNGPGAIGRGRGQRESAESYFTDIRSAIHDLAQSMRAENCDTVGVLAGSMAAVPLLRLLGPQSYFDACALVAPLLEASIPVTDPVRPDLLDDPLIEALDHAVAKVDTPTLVVYGARDEVVPLEQMSRLYRHAPSPGIVELSVIEDEGHIFNQMSSWRHTLRTVESFFSAHLAPEGAPAHRRPRGTGV